MGAGALTLLSPQQATLRLGLMPALTSVLAE